MHRAREDRRIARPVVAALERERHLRASEEAVDDLDVLAEARTAFGGGPVGRADRHVVELLDTFADGELESAV